MEYVATIRLRGKGDYVEENEAVSCSTNTAAGARGEAI